MPNTVSIYVGDACLFDGGKWWGYDNYTVDGYTVLAGRIAQGPYLTVYYHVCIIKFTPPAMSGPAQDVTFTLTYSNLPKNKNIRWAICTSDTNKNAYVGTSGVVSDANQLGSGILTFVDNLGGSIRRSFTAPVPVEAGKTYYLFFWSGDKGNYNIKVARPKTQMTFYVTYSLAPPVIVTQPTGASYNMGDAATALSVTATGSATLTYQWYQDGNAIPDATGPSYTPSTDQEGTCSYYCRVTNSSDGDSTAATSDTVQITVFAAATPSVEISPASVSAEQLAEATAFTASASAAQSGTKKQGTLSYRWYKNDALIPNATQASYTPSTDTIGQATFRCIVTNTVGTSEAVASASATLSVSAQTPVIKKQPVDALYRQGWTASPLSVSASVTSGTLTYQWYQNGVSISGATAASYTPSTADVGVNVYYCVVKNSAAGSYKTTQTESVNVSIVAPTPVFTAKLLSSTYLTGATPAALNGQAEGGPNGSITYQWYMATPGQPAQTIQGATGPTYTPSAANTGTFYYYVVASNNYLGTIYTGRSNTATIVVVNAISLPADNYSLYLQQLLGNYTAVKKLEFLNPDGSVAFQLDNNPQNTHSGAFLQDGTLSCNLQNGARRTASVRIGNADGDFDFSVNHIWFGQEIRLSEGLILPSGEPYYIPQGVFLADTPNENYNPTERTMVYNLTDKWANLDGRLGGSLEGSYQINAGTNIFDALTSLLRLDRFTMGNNGKDPIDRLAPLCTSYYNNRTQTLTDGSIVSLATVPYDLLVDGIDGTIADLVTGLTNMLAAWVGYNPSGRLSIDPSQDDISDATKPVDWAFTPEEVQFLGATYTVKNTEVYNDIIVVGATSGTGRCARGRAQNRDPSSDTCISRIGLKTKRIEMSDYYSDDICQAYAAWMLKRYAVLTKSITIECGQMFHIEENNIVTLMRPDKPGNPTERHVVQGFSRPIAQTGSMTINAISVTDFPIATLIDENGDPIN